MGMLDRYQKSGGFLQLVQLLETCGEAKRKKLLDMIDQEDARWGSAIRKKMLTVEVIFSWPQEQLAEVVGQLQDLTLAFALKGLDPKTQEKALLTVSHGQKRRLHDLTDGREVSVAEISTAFARIIDEVRGQISGGYIRLREFDPKRAIEEDIEEKLALAPLFDSPEEQAAVSGEDLVFDIPTTGDSDGGGQVSTELQRQVNHLKNDVALLKRENGRLKAQAAQSKDTISKIKKLLAA